jgi:ribosomal protein S6--L-glutamate ligase
VRIAILSRNARLYSTRRLAQSARMRGHQVRVIDTISVPANVGGDLRAGLGDFLPEADAMVPRIGTSVTFYGLAVVRQLEALGLVTTATAEAIACSRDKLHSLQLMSGAGLPIPITTVIANSDDIWSAIRTAGGLPVVIKLIRGTQGRGVFLASEVHTVESIWDAMNRVREQMLIQEYIRESHGRDTRVIVVGNRCVAAMQRTAAAGEFRSNLHRGGSAVAVELDQQSRELAVRAAHAHGLGVAGVDIIHSDRGPLALEVNSSPGLEGIEMATRKDVAVEIIRYLELELKKQQQRRRRKRTPRR